MSLRTQVENAVATAAFEELEELVSKEPRAIRYLLGLTYRDDEEIRRNASRGIALAARHQPKHVDSLVRRLVWAMNEESGTNALTAPGVLQAIAAEDPEILKPVAPDLLRLSQDEGLREGLAVVLQALTKYCPGALGQEMTRVLNKNIHKGRTTL
jgi:hypothetical protein